MRRITLTLLGLCLAACGGPNLVTPTPPTPSPPTTPSTQTATESPAPPNNSPTPSPSAKPLAGKKIVLDPGHNGANAKNPTAINKQVPDGRGGTKKCNTTGTAAKNGYPEHALNWAVAQAVSEKLQALGAQVVFTRDSDTGVGPCVNERARIGNDSGADLVLSIHADGNKSASARGFHLIVSPSMAGGKAVQDDSKRLAAAIIKAFPATGMPISTYIGGGTGLSVRNEMAGLNLSKIPAVMLEAGNMMHVEDARLFGQSSFRDAEATALVAAIRQYLDGPR